MAKTVLGNRKPVFDIEKLAREQNENIKKSGAANVPSTPVKVQPEQVRRDILKERGTIVRPLPTVKRTPHPPQAVPLPLKGKASAESRKENAINTRRRGLVPYSIQDIEAGKKRTEQLKADVERRTPTEVTANKKTYTYTPSSQAVGHSSYGLKFDVSKMGDDFINTNSPFGNYRITSKTGARKSPTAGASTNHAGIDRDVPEGTVISLPMDTTFHASGYDKSRGFWIEVKDASGNILHYQHLMDYGRFGEGEKLSAGTPIARSGSSGAGTGAHLHEEYYSPDGRNITESYWAKYAGQSAEDIEKWKKEKENLGISVYKVDNPAFDAVKSNKKSLPEKAGAVLSSGARAALHGFNSSFYGTFDMVGEMLKKNKKFLHVTAISRPGGIIYSAIVEGITKFLDSDFFEKGLLGSEKQKLAVAQHDMQTAADAFETKAGKNTAYIAGSFVQNGIEMIPTLVLALLSQGTSTAASLPANSTKAVSYLKGLVKNPQFWNSYIRQAGNSYLDAKDNGATEEQAQAAANITGFINSAIELSGGIESDVAKPILNGGFIKSFTRAFFENAPEEALEGGLQDITENLVNKLLYKKNAPVFSTTDENAVYNPARLSKNMAMEGFMGGLFGGGNVILRSVVNRLGGGSKLSDTLKTMTPEELAKVKTAFANVNEKVKSGKITTQEEFDADEDVKAIRFSVKKDNPYAYNNLVANEDMNVVKVSDNVPRTAEGKVDRNSIKTAGMQNAFTIGTKVNDHLAIVKNRYSGSNIAISWGKIGHSLDRRGAVSSIIPKMGEIVQNAIRVNEMNRDTPNVNTTYPMISIAENEKGETIPVLLIINDISNGNPELIDLGVSEVLYSSNAKKENQLPRKNARTSATNAVHITDSKISISNAIDVVKNYFPDVLSDDVLSRYGLSKNPNSKYTGVKYSVSNAEGNVKGDNERQFGETQKKFFDAFGVEVVMDESLDANAEVLLDDGVVKVSPYADIDDWKITRHEFTHLLKVLAPEAYELYARLAREEIGDRWDEYYAEAKRDYTAYYEKKGKEVTDDLIKEEVLARYAEGLDNNDFIRKVARESTSVAVKVRNILKRIVDKIKAVFSRGERAGTPENIKKIITAKDAWENAAIEAAKKKGRVVSGNGRYAIGYTLDNSPVVVINDNILAGKNKSEWVKAAKEAMSKIGGAIPVKGRFIKVNKITKSEYTNSKYTRKIKKADPVIYKDKLTAAGHVDEIVLASTNYINEDLGHSRSDSFKQFARGNVLMEIGGKKYKAEVIIGFTGGNSMVLYDLVDISPTLFNKKTSAPSAENMSKKKTVSTETRVPVKDEPHPTRISTAEFVSRSGRRDGSSSKNSIYRKDENVNSKLSVPRNERTDSFRLDLFSQEMKFLRGLESENAHLKEVNDILKRFFRQTAMVHVDALHISEYAEHIKKVYETHMPAKEIATELQRIYTKMAEDGARAESDAQKAEAANVGANALFELARKILDQSDAVDRSMYDRYAELRHTLRTDGISISESDARDIPDFNDFRRQNMGRVKISSDGISVDSYYEELVELYPELFASEEITAPSDRLLKIVKVRDMLDPKYRDVAYTDDEAAALAVEMYAEYFSDENAAFEQQSLAAMIKDKYAKSLREEYNDKLKKTVDFYREQVEFYRNLNQNVEERIADVPMGEVQRNGFVDTEIKKEFSWYESGLKDTGVKVVRRQSPGGKKDTVLMTFERPTREALRNNSDYNEIISRVKERIKQDWEEGKSGKTQFGYSRSNVWRSFRRFFGDRDYRKMKELILDPFDDSVKQFMHIQEFYSQLIYKKVVKELGIKKGSELSALVQKYGEKVLTAEELEAISEEDMKKIQIADRLFRACYDGLIDTVNDTRRAIYPDADKKAQKLEDDILNIEKEIGLIELGFMTGDFTDVNGFNNYNLERIAIRQESAKELEYRIRLDAEKRAALFDARIAKLEEDMAATANKTTKRYADLQERLAKYQAEKAKWAAIAESRQVELQEKIAELNEEFRSNTEYYKQKLDKRLARLNEKLGEKKALLETDEITYGRTIQKRKDYYRHFEDLASEVPVFFGYIQQMTQDKGKTVIQAAKDYFERRSQKANIDNRLAGKSADTKPRAKWQSFAQHRTDGATAVKYDAVGGFLEYLPAAAYSAAIDPQISIFRTIAEDLAAKVDGKDNNNNLGSFIGYLQEYANDLAGKTHAIDRVIVENLMSRDSWNKLNWLTGRIKSNMIAFNVSSMFAQILNMPNAIATIKNPVYFIGAMRDVIAGLDSNGKIADRYKHSRFLNERYINYYSKFEGGFSGNARKVSDWMLQAFDELGGRVIWNAAYRKAVKLGEKSPVRYADDLTRRMIAGRGIGEMQLYQKSRLVGMIMSFSVEVANNWDAIEDIARDAAQSGRKHTGVIKAAVVGGQTALGLLMLFFASRLFNVLLKWLRGSDGGLLDPLGAIEEGIKNGDDVGEILGSIAGNAIGATPIGAAAATLYPEQGIQIGEYSTPTRSELFGSNDPTRYGTGNLFSSALKKPVNYLVMPTGGAQLDKTLTGIKAYKEGAVKKKNGDTLYEVDRNPANAVKGALFGKSGLIETKEYYDKKDSGGIYDKYLKPKGGIKSEQFKELNRLIKIDDSIKPSKPGMSFVYNDVEYKLNGRYYDTYEKMYGRRASQYYNKLMLSSEYKAANDELKVVMVKDAFRAALSDAKDAYVKWQKSGADKDGGSFEQSFVSEFIGKKIVGNSDAAKSFSAEGFNKGKGYAEVQLGDNTFILQGDAYNAYEQARYDAFEKNMERMSSSGTITVKNETRKKSEVTKMKAILKQLVSDGVLENSTAREMLYNFAKGYEVEVPAGVEFVLGRQEEYQAGYSELTSDDKKNITASLKRKIKAGDMTMAEAKQYLQDVKSGKKTVTKKRYITGDFNSLSDEQQEKVLNALNDKVKESALDAVKGLLG